MYYLSKSLYIYTYGQSGGRRYWSVISKKYFRPGRMAPSEWMRSIRAVRDTPVADYSAPGLNTTRRIAYCPPNAVSPVLLALSVFYFKRTLWRWANCDHTSKWVHWVYVCIWIALRWVTLRKSLLAFLLPVRKMQFSLY